MELNFVFYNFNHQDPPKGNAVSTASMYHQAGLRGRILRLWAWITRQPCRLESLEGLRAASSVSSATA
jgi:hypothetical protein